MVRRSPLLAVLVFWATFAVGQDRPFANAPPPLVDEPQVNNWNAKVSDLNSGLTVNEQGMLLGTVPTVLPEMGPAQYVLEGSDPDKVFYRNQLMLVKEAMLPAPLEGNDVFQAQFDSTSARMGMPWTPIASLLAIASPEAPKDLWTRFKAMPNFGMAYDTGFIPGSGTFDVQSIALGQDPAAGQTRFNGSEQFDNVPVALLFDNQMRNADIAGYEQVQFYVEANNYEERDELKLRHIFGRVWDADRLTVGAGKTHSLFGVGGMTPATLDQSITLIGTGDLDDEKRAQLRWQLSAPSSGGWFGGLAIEDPYRGDFAPPADTTPLTRWPSFAGNFGLSGDNGVDRLQFSALLRTLGLEDAGGAEHFNAAWGLAAYLRLATIETDYDIANFYAGIAGGQGIGQYVHGVSTSAVFEGGQLDSLGGLGAYVGYQRQWITANNWEFGANLAYGFAMMDTPSFLPADANRELHQAWANVLFFPNKYVAVGLEYQYGERETRASGSGENHRFMLTVALTSSPAKEEGARFLQESAPSAMASAARSAFADSVPGGAGTSPSGNQASRQQL